MMKMVKRVNRRYKYEADISHDIVIPDIFYDGKIYNFSNEGMYFESNEQILPGDEISITIKKLPQKDIEDAQKTFDVEILWRKDLRDSSFLYGYGAKLVRSKGSLINLFDKSKLKKIDLNNHDREDSTYEKDPRRHPRKIYNKKLKFVHHQQIYQGFATNISRGGAFIKTKKKFPLGGKIELIMQGKEIRKDVIINGWIVRLDETGVGIKFDLRSKRRRRGDLDRRVSVDRRKRLEPRG